ncbi:hypothetical protein CTheo_7493 [Ceratobasidium theobromae]|uniref:Transmembrane protein n=1 Tax=Ceratobasidium theobromae TaxID=1582974 RepID=A0A5N5QBB3_9AGAM|nr:hypothetical protein CTheo_7493 [Ceratobasidium theobromae]
MTESSAVTLRRCLILALSCLTIYAISPVDAPPLLQPDNHPFTHAVGERPHPAPSLDGSPVLAPANNTQELLTCTSHSRTKCLAVTLLEDPELAYGCSTLSTVSRIRCQVYETMTSTLELAYWPSIPTRFVAFEQVLTTGIKLSYKPLDLMIRLHLLSPPPASITATKPLTATRTTSTINLPSPTTAHTWRKGTVLIDRSTCQHSGVWLRDDLLRYIAESLTGQWVFATWVRLVLASEAMLSLASDLAVGFQHNLMSWIDSLFVYAELFVSQFSGPKLEQLVSKLGAAWSSMSNSIGFEFTFTSSPFEDILEQLDFSAWCSSILDFVLWDFGILALLVFGSAFVAAQTSESVRSSSNTSICPIVASALPPATALGPTLNDRLVCSPPFGSDFKFRPQLMIEWHHPIKLQCVLRAELRLHDPLCALIIVAPTNVYDNILFYKLRLALEPTRPTLLLLGWYPTQYVDQSGSFETAFTESNRFEHVQNQHEDLEQVDQDVQGETLEAETTEEPKRRRRKTRRGCRGRRHGRNENGEANIGLMSGESSQAGGSEVCG